jgi:hypothetical protein
MRDWDQIAAASHALFVRIKELNDSHEAGIKTEIGTWDLAKVALNAALTVRGRITLYS